MDESDADSGGVVENGMDEVQRVWRYLKVRKYISGGGGSIGRVKVSIDMNRNGRARGGGTSRSARGKSLVGLRDVRETGFGPCMV